MANFHIGEANQYKPIKNPIGKESIRHAKLKLLGKIVLKEKGYESTAFEVPIRNGSDKRSTLADVIGVYNSKDKVGCVECKIGPHYMNNPFNKEFPHKTSKYSFDDYIEIREYKGNTKIKNREESQEGQ